MNDEVDERPSAEVTPAPHSAATPPPAATPSAPLPVDANSAVNTVNVRVGEEVIRTCVTPSKVKSVQDALDKEQERHRCAVRLLPYFFTKEELTNSNTDGTHGKRCLDNNKLNSIKVLVFNKFPVDTAAEKAKMWKFIKTKINARCRASKFASREV